MEITGKVETILPKEQIKTYEKQIFTVRTSDEYDNLYAFDAFGEKGMKLMEKVSKGAEVTVSFNVRTNEHNGKYYTSLSPWRVETTSSASPAQPRVTSKEEANFADQSGEAVVEYVEEDDLSLPF